MNKPWCLYHNELLIKGVCPYDILIEFMESIEELGNETDGSHVDMEKLDRIYQTAITKFQSPQLLEGRISNGN